MSGVMIGSGAASRRSPAKAMPEASSPANPIRFAIRMAFSSMDGARSRELGLVEPELLVEAARHDTERDVDAIPRIDRHDREGEIGNLFLRKLSAHALVELVGHAKRRNLRQ